MSVLITGGTGFIGAYVVRRLVREGQRVVTLDNLPSNVIHGVLAPEELSQVSFVTGDVSSLRDVGHAIRDNQVDRVVHLPSLLHPASNENPPLAIRVNVQGQATILEAARLFGRAPSSSSALVAPTRSGCFPTTRRIIPCTCTVPPNRSTSSSPITTSTSGMLTL